MTTARLTPRQRQVVVLLAEGRSCPEIARRMAISIETVRAHIKAVRKLLDDSSGLPALRVVRRDAKKLLAA